MLTHAFLAAMATAEIEKGAEETIAAPARASPWQKSGDSWQLAIPSQLSNKRTVFTPRAGQDSDAAIKPPPAIATTNVGAGRNTDPPIPHPAEHQPANLKTRHLTSRYSETLLEY